VVSNLKCFRVLEEKETLDWQPSAHLFTVRPSSWH